MPSPERLWVFDLTCKLATGLQLLNGTRTQQTADDIEANLTTLEAEDFPLKYYDVDGTSYDVQIVNRDKRIVPNDVGDRASGQSEHMELAMRLQLREVKTS
jgi:hypothetical protein